MGINALIPLYLPTVFAWHKDRDFLSQGATLGLSNHTVLSLLWLLVASSWKYQQISFRLLFCNFTEVRFLHRAQRIKQAAACSPFCLLARDREVSAAVSPEWGAALLFFRRWGSWTHPLNSKEAFSACVCRVFFVVLPLMRFFGVYNKDENW